MIENILLTNPILMRGLLLVLSLLLLSLNFIDVDIIGEPDYNLKEKYNPSLGYINSVDRLIEYTDSSAKATSISLNSIEYFVLLKNIVSDRFYHGFSHYTLSQNWIAVLGQKIFGHGLATKVFPDDIMKNQMAGCSQQSSIIMAVAVKKNIPYRSVGFPHHYALELNYKNNWYFFDPDMEPSLSIHDRLHQNWNGENDNLKKYYFSGGHKNVDFEFGNKTKATLGVVNQVPAPRLKIFLTITRYLSTIAWIIPLLFFLIFSKKISFINFKRSAVPHLLPA